MVTLTAKSVTAGKLGHRVEAMFRALRIILARNKKRAQRGTERRMIGICSLECNFKPEHRWYNPHFHILVPDEAIAELLLQEWLQLWGKRFTSRSGQHIRSVGNTEHDVCEVINYGTKTFTEPGATRKSKNKKPALVYIPAMDNIYNAFKGYRLFERFGFNCPKAPKKEKLPARWVKDVMKWAYHRPSGDWVNPDYEATLKGFEGQIRLQGVLEQELDLREE